MEGVLVNLRLCVGERYRHERVAPKYEDDPEEEQERTAPADPLHYTGRPATVTAILGTHAYDFSASALATASRARFAFALSRRSMLAAPRYAQNISEGFAGSR